MKPKYYFFKHDEEICYDEQYFQDYMEENKLTEVKVYVAERETGTGWFFCKESLEAGESKESCGKICEKYIPRNGKAGICKYHGYVYDSGKEITLKLKN